MIETLVELCMCLKRLITVAFFGSSEPFHLVNGVPVSAPSLHRESINSLICTYTTMQPLGIIQQSPQLVNHLIQTTLLIIICKLPHNINIWI